MQKIALFLLIFSYSTWLNATDKNTETLSTSIEESKPSGKIWNLRNANIRAVIDEVSRITGKNFIVDSRVQGKISIVSNTPLSDDELYQVFLSMLQVSGYVAIPSGKLTKIIPNAEAKTQASNASSSVKNQPQGDELMVQVIPVHHTSADQLVPILRPLLPHWSNVSSHATSNTLIFSGPANALKQVTNIIKQVDNSSLYGVDVVPLKHALAMDIANTLKDLVKPQPGAPANAQTTLAADDRNNALLISGSKTERLRLRLLISRLDKPGPYGGDSNTQVVYLNYLRAEDLVPILAGIAQASFSGVVGTTIGTITRPALDSTNPASSMVEGSSSGGEIAASMSPDLSATPNTSASQTEGSSKPSIQIIGEPNTNSIIINGPPTLIRTLKSIISQLDIKPAQILIEALVAEVNESDVNHLGAAWGSKEKEIFRPGFAIVNSKASLGQIEAQIHALAKQRRANILSTPSVIVLDNRQAKILIGKQVSVINSSYPGNAGGSAAANPFNTYNRVNVALHLYVRPQITRGRGIQMQIDQGNDTLDPSSSALDPASMPTFNISAIVTSVHVDSGNVIVLGGLTQDSFGNDDQRIPILGDVPGIGRLFQNNRSSREKKVLMVFIRPKILGMEEDSLQVSGAKYTDVRQYQLDVIRTQEYDKRNSDSLLPPWNKAELPRPFTRQAATPHPATETK